MDAYLEVGAKRVFACAIDWPGWARSARDPDVAIETLLAYAPRYAAVAKRARAGFKAPRALTIVERLQGGATTDFGVPGKVPSADLRSMDARELARLERLLRASWEAFDDAAKAAAGVRLRTGPRGGGRDVAKMTAHVLEGDQGYLTALGGAYKTAGRSVAAEVERVREAFVTALEARARGEVPGRGPRGGKRWPPRYAVRRSAWHALDHAWEIEDRASG